MTRVRLNAASPGSHARGRHRTAERLDTMAASYEAQREANIRRNEELLRDLGLREAAAAVVPPKRNAAPRSAGRTHRRAGRLRGLANAAGRLARRSPPPCRTPKARREQHKAAARTDQGLAATASGAPLH